MAHSYIPSALLVLIISLAIFYIYSFTSSTNYSAPWLTNNSTQPSTNATPPAIFIFGDSTSDVGTNNFVKDNRFRADEPYYGIDFDDSRPSGRFNNGFITVDFVSQLMGFKRSPPPFLFINILRSDFEKKKFKGANFASAGSGLLNTTSDYEKIVPMSEQVNQFITVRSHLTDWMGQSSVDYLLSKSIFLISAGSNDIIQNFNTTNIIPKEEFIRTLMTTYENDIKVLYNHGARKFGMISVLPMGCCPAMRVLNSTGGCLEIMNEFALNFYLELDTLLHKISSEFHGFKYSLGNTYRMTMDVIQNPARFNFTNVDTACCGSGRLNAEQTCDPTANLCENRSEYAYWDVYHPTQAAAQLAAQSLYGGEIRLVSPINFGQLAADN